MNFDKAIILVLLFSNLSTLHLNRKLFDLIEELSNLFDQVHAINKKLIARIERD